MAVAFRFFALFLIVVALMLLGADVITSLQDKNITVRSLEQVWALISPSSLGAAKHWLEVTLPPPAPKIVFAFLTAWAWGVIGVLGVIIAFLLGRDHHAS